MADPFSMWGAEQSGVLTAEKHMAEQLKHQLDAVYRMGQIQDQPAINAQHQAAARLATARSIKFESEARQAEEAARLMRAASEGSEGAQQDPVRVLGTAASNMAKAGLIEQASKTYDAASKIQRRQVMNEGTAVNAMRDQLTMQVTESGLIGRFFDPAKIKTQDDYTRANALYTFTTGRPSPWAQLPYEPGIVQQIWDSSMSTKERAEGAIRDLEQARKDRNTNSSVDLRTKRKEILDETLRLAKAREERLAKGGGGKITGPSKDMKEAAEKLMLQDYPGVAGSREIAYNIASAAAALLKENRALDPATAVQRAYRNAKERGDFLLEDLPGTQGFIDRNNPGTDKFKGKRIKLGAGTAADAPLALPKKESELVKGRFYNSPGAGLVEWTGTGFRRVGPANTTNVLPTNNPNIDPDDPDNPEDPDE